MRKIIKPLYDALIWPIHEKHIGTLQAASVVRSLYLKWTLEKYISANKEFRILDAGSGQGAPLATVQARLHPQCYFEALDLYQEEPTDQRLDLPKNIKYIKTELESFVPNEKYDIVISLDVLEHIEDHQAILNRISHWMKPDGVFIIHTPATNQVRYFTKESHHHGPGNGLRRGDYHTREGFELKELIADVESEGFRVIHSRYTFSYLTWFFKELYTLGEKRGLPGIGIIIFPFLYLSTKVEHLINLKRGNGLLIEARKA